MSSTKINKNKKIRRQIRTRSKINGTSNQPRLTVFISNNHIYAQVIDDNKGQTLVSANDFELDQKDLKKSEKAVKIGELIADKAKSKKITKVVFDRGHYSYHGHVKLIAEAAREAGLKF